jgi:hypothetical protein
MSKMKAWSYSSQDSYATCPYRFQQEKLLKLYLSETTEAQQWGTDVHTALEHRVRDKTPLAERFAHLEGAAKLVEALPGKHFFEAHLACKRPYYAPCDPADKENAWVHGYLDFMSIIESPHNDIDISTKGTEDTLDSAIVADYKTGRNRPTKQMHLYAAMIFSNFPKVRTVKTALIYLKTGELVKEKFERGADFFRLWEIFLPTIKRMENSFESDHWPKNPSGLCAGWCPVDCEFRRAKR